MWDILFEYTSRVHSITITHRSIPSTVIEPLGVLILSCPSTPASWFPNLRKLTWHAEGAHAFAQFLRMALVPSILVLHVEISSASPTFLSVLSSLGTSCPHLQNMTIRTRCKTDDGELLRQISPFIAQPISQLHHLHMLSIWDLGSQATEHIMQLRAMQSLSLDLTASSAWNKKPSLQFPGFDDLKWLGLSIHSIEHASNFLSSFQVVRSKQIEVGFTSDLEKYYFDATASTISQFLAILHERCDHDKLEYLSLSIGHFKGIRIESGAFRKLRAFANLTQLVIEGAGSVSMSDEELCQLASAWPKLQPSKSAAMLPPMPEYQHSMG